MTSRLLTELLARDYPSERLMSETLVPRQPGPEFGVRQHLGDPNLMLEMLRGEPSPVQPARPTPEGYYDRFVAALERGRDLMGGPPSVAGSVGLAMNAVPAGRMAQILASRSARMYNPPRSYRPFEADYPQGARADASGRLTHDIEGRGLQPSALVVGRRVLGGMDQGARPQEYDALAAAIVGRAASLQPAKDMGRDFGRTLVNRYTGQPTDIYLRSGLREDQLQKVYAHELAEALIARAGQMPTKGITDELKKIYNTLNNPNRSFGGAEAASWGKPTTPEAYGYKGKDVQRESVAEAIRAYLDSPNYIKTEAPKTAAGIRKWFNAHPETSPIIQFNSIGAGLFAPLTFPLAGAGQRPEISEQ